MPATVNIVVADAEEGWEIAASSRPVETWRGFVMDGLDMEKLAILQSMLTGQTFDEALAECEPHYVVSDEGPWVTRLPEELTESLVELDEEKLEQIGEELALTAEFEAEGWPVEVVQSFVAELGALADVAAAQGNALFVWVGAGR